MSRKRRERSTDTVAAQEPADIWRRTGRAVLDVFLNRRAHALDRAEKNVMGGKTRTTALQCTSSGSGGRRRVAGGEPDGQGSVKPEITDPAVVEILPSLSPSDFLME